MALSVLNPEAVRQAPLSREPYTFFLGSGVLKEDTIPDLKRDFPNITKPGYLTVDEVDLKGRFKTLVDELESEEFTEELSKKFGKDLHPFPRLIESAIRIQLLIGVPIDLNCECSSPANR